MATKKQNLTQKNVLKQGKSTVQKKHVFTSLHSKEDKRCQNVSRQKLKVVFSNSYKVDSLL